MYTMCVWHAQALSQKQSAELGVLKAELSGLEKDLEDERLGREQGGQQLKEVGEEAHTLCAVSGVLVLP